MKTLLLSALAMAGLSSDFVPPQAVKGSVQGFTNLSSDGFIDGAIVVPSISATNLISLQLGGLLAPNETLNAGPITAKVPGNLYIPEQTEVYGFPITLSKPSFTTYQTPGKPNELAAVAFRGDINNLAQVGQSGAPYTRLIPFVKVTQMAFATERDWTTVAQPIGLQLAYKPAKTLSYQWSHSAPPSNATDIALAFQQTPAQRWMLSDFAAGTLSSGKIGSMPNFQPNMKVLIGRVYDSPVENDRYPGSASVYVVTASNTDSVSLSGVPEQLTGAALNGTRLSWNPIHQQGWMAVLRATKDMFRQPEVPYSWLSLGLANLTPTVASLMAPLPNALEAWVAPDSGSFELTRPLGTDKMMLVFVGTDQAVEAPIPQFADAEPAIFTHATELRFARVLSVQ
ncbi:MAG: hypothetical protein JST16_15675 [Bdellovibrionales bacterium]|nr:hypothetical protein [Bdellovibrionales bacterium]